MSINWSQVKSVAIYALGLAGVVLGAIPTDGVSASVHSDLVVIGGVIVAVERYLQSTNAAAHN